MTLFDRLSRRLLAPPATGIRAILYGAILIAVPTLIRLMLALAVDRWPFFAYVPFILIAAIILDWKYACATAFGAWVAADL